MSYVVAWIDSQEAKLFHFSPGKVDKEDIKRTAEEHEEGKFFHRVADHMKLDSHVLVVGPGLGKKHFVHHLETHKTHKALVGRIVGVENADHPTDGQIQELARKFFKKFDLFQNP